MKRSPFSSSLPILCRTLPLAFLLASAGGVAGFMPLSASEPPEVGSIDAQRYAPALVSDLRIGEIDGSVRIERRGRFMGRAPDEHQVYEWDVFRTGVDGSVHLEAHERTISIDSDSVLAVRRERGDRRVELDLVYGSLTIERRTGSSGAAPLIRAGSMEVPIDEGARITISYTPEGEIDPVPESLHTHVEQSREPVGAMILEELDTFTRHFLAIRSERPIIDALMRADERAVRAVSEQLDHISDEAQERIEAAVNLSLHIERELRAIAGPPVRRRPGASESGALTRLARPIADRVDLFERRARALRYALKLAVSD